MLSVLKRNTFHKATEEIHQNVRCCEPFAMESKIQAKLTISNEFNIVAKVMFFRLEVTSKERQDVIKTLTKQIDTLSHGRGDCDSYMGAHILRYLFW